MIFRFAWRNIWRHKARSLLTLAAIAFATAILVFFIGLQQSSYQATINANVSLFHGHFQIQDTQYFQRYDIRHSFHLTPEQDQQLSTLPGIEALAKRSTAFGVVSTENRSYAAQIIGVEPKNEKLVSTIPGVIRSGSFLSDTSQYQAVIGKDLAKNLKASIGDELTFLGSARDGSVAASVFEIVGIFESGSRELDRATVEIPIEIFDEVFAMQGQVHSYVVRATEAKQLAVLRSKLEATIKDSPNLVVLDWEQLIPGLRQAIELDMAAGWLFFFSLVVIVSFSVVNTFLMSVLERTKEFGVMLALGQKPSGIGKLIALECLFLSSVGIIVGIIIGSAFLTYFGITGFHIPGSEEIVKVWNLPVVLYPKVGLKALLQGPLIILTATIFAIIYPLVKVLKLEAIEALNAR